MIIRIKRHASLMSFLKKNSNCRKHFPIRLIMSVLIGGLLIIVYIPGSLLLRPLETRFPLWRPVTTDQVVGVGLLGGFHLDSYVRQRLEIHPGLSERVMETARLSKFYPEARILYSGGGMEAPLVKKVLIRLGVDEQK